MNKEIENNDFHVKCSQCGRVLKCRTPKGGDGSGYFPVYHKANGGTCMGYKLEGERIQ